MPTMALFHAATVTPTKNEVLASWIAAAPWGDAQAEVDVVGSYRFDDPEGEVGLETFIVRVGDRLLHLPLTYRGAPLEGGEDALLTEMEHTVLGTRWVYDGLLDPRYVIVLAGVSLTGQGEALGMVEYEGDWRALPAAVRISGGGYTRAANVNGFTLEPGGGATAVLRNERFELSFHREVTTGAKPPIGLTGSWERQQDPVVLTEIRQLERS
jgi:hypothetical protein